MREQWACCWDPGWSLTSLSSKEGSHFAFNPFPNISVSHKLSSELSFSLSACSGSQSDLDVRFAPSESKPAELLLLSSHCHPQFSCCLPIYSVGCCSPGLAFLCLVLSLSLSLFPCLHLSIFSFFIFSPPPRLLFP